MENNTETSVIDNKVYISDNTHNKTQDKKEHFIWKVLAYFFIYSFLGFLLETIFGILTKGVIESRKSMLYGPFCCIYGVGAVFLTYVPKKIKKHNYQLFLYGTVMGSITEYLVSLIGECIFNIQWWDYSNYPFNINGRVCLLFAFIWGFCTLVLNKFFNPTIDKIINKLQIKFPKKIIHIFLIILTIIIILDNLVSSFALKMFYTRLIKEYNIENVAGAEKYYDKYLTMYEKYPIIKDIVDRFFSDKVMILAFPNIKIRLNDGSTIWIRNLLKDIQPYYIKIFEPQDNIFVRNS